MLTICSVFGCLFPELGEVITHNVFVLSWCRMGSFPNHVLKPRKWAQLFFVFIRAERLIVDRKLWKKCICVQWIAALRDEGRSIRKTYVPNQLGRWRYLISRTTQMVLQAPLWKTEQKTENFSPFALVVLETNWRTQLLGRFWNCRSSETFAAQGQHQAFFEQGPWMDKDTTRRTEILDWIYFSAIVFPASDFVLFQPKTSCVLCWENSKEKTNLSQKSLMARWTSTQQVSFELDVLNSLIPQAKWEWGIRQVVRRCLVSRR